MCSKILPLFPKYDVYVEPFCGAGTLLFAQRPESKVEVLNDINSLVFNFFDVLKTQYKDLVALLNNSFYSQELYVKSTEMCRNGTGTPLERAEAFFIAINQAFGKIIGGGWAFDSDGGRANAYNNKVERLRACALRLKKVSVSNEDALKCIKRWDGPGAFFYCDPPYIGTDCGHYAGYTDEAYAELIKTLEGIEGKAMVSGYENDIVPQTWKRHKFAARSSVNNVKEKNYDMRIEVVFEKP